MTKQKAGTPEIKLIKTVDLIPYVMNSRTHSPDQVSQIAASIKEFGFTNPVLTDGSNGIIAGHGRVMAAQKLGIDEVPVIELSYLSEAQRKAYIIADNKLALNAGWDNEVLAAEIVVLEEIRFDINLLGFDQKEIDNLLCKNIMSDEKNKASISDSQKFILMIEFDSEYQISEAYDIYKNKGFPCKIID